MRKLFLGGDSANFDSISKIINVSQGDYTNHSTRYREAVVFSEKPLDFDPYIIISEFIIQGTSSEKQAASAVYAEQARRMLQLSLPALNRAASAIVS